MHITHKIIQGVAPFYLQLLLNHLSCPKQTKKLSFKGPKPTTATEEFLLLPQGCGMACHNI
jgi:hypothetical protein